MSTNAPKNVHQIVDAIYCTESRRVFATLIRLLGDFDAALVHQEPERRFLQRRLGNTPAWSTRLPEGGLYFFLPSSTRRRI